MTHSGSTTYSGLTGTSHAIDNLLYGKAFSVSIFAYNHNSTSRRSQYTRTITATVEDHSGTNENDVSFNLTAQQNGVSGAIQLQSIDSFGNSLGAEQDWVKIEFTPYQFEDNSYATQYEVYEQYKLMGTIDYVDVSNNDTILLARRFVSNASNSTQLMGNNVGIYINIVAKNTSLYSKPGTTKYIETLGIAPAPYPQPPVSLSIAPYQNSVTVSWSKIDIWNHRYDVYQIRVGDSVHNEDETRTPFTLQEITNSIDSNSVRIATNINATSYTHSGLRDNGKYAYRVIAYNRDGVRFLKMKMVNYNTQQLKLMMLVTMEYYQILMYRLLQMYQLLLL